MKLTIGMACHDDFHGVAFSIQSLRLHQGLSDYEIIVVDNAPTTEHGKATAGFCESLNSGNVRYISMPDKTGTSQSRQRIFDEARGEAVLAMDCHVLFPGGTLGRLVKFYDSNPDCRDLLSGPLMLNHFAGFHTHFNPQWRGGMWGTWATAWTCTCKKPLRFTTLEVGAYVVYRDLASCSQEVNACPSCGRKLPALDWAGHEARLTSAKFQPLGFSDSDPVFEIPGQGLGVFTCRKDAWLGFNPHFRGFGGEELYIHTKFRQAGARALCLPWLKWWHRFERPDGVKYPLSHYLKIRNYVLGHQELGLDLEPVYQHFVNNAVPDGQTLLQHLLEEHAVDLKTVEGRTMEQLIVMHRNLKLSQVDWEFLLADPVAHIRVESIPNSSITLNTERVQPPKGATLDEIYEWCRNIPRDLDQHLPMLRDLAAKCGHVTEITKRRESSVGLLAARPHTLISYQKEQDILLQTLSVAITEDAKKREGTERHVVEHVIHWGVDSSDMNVIAVTDMLFIDTVHTADRLKLELGQHASQVRRYLVFRGTGANGEQGEANQPGLFHAIRPFLIEHPEWFVIYHTDNEYGITALSRVEEDRPAKRVHAWPPGFGPGTEFKQLCEKELNITMPEGCSCNALMVQMDYWGPEDCKLHHKEIVKAVHDNESRWKWNERLTNIAKAGTNALLSGLAFKISWTDPVPGLLDEAIARSEKKQEAI